jgi:SAM-dependent MidA family methyltransferase
VLEAPGDADLTSHVDFEALASALRRGGAAVHGPLTQGEFLSAMGLAERGEVLKRQADTRDRSDIEAAAERLAAQSQMGHLFKVIAATHPDLPPPYPFPNPMQRPGA